MQLLSDRLATRISHSFFPFLVSFLMEREVMALVCVCELPLIVVIKSSKERNPTPVTTFLLTKQIHMLQVLQDNVYVL